MLLRFVRYGGLLAGLALIVPMAAAGFVATDDLDLGLTADPPGDVPTLAAIGDPLTIYYDDFSYCDDYPCSILDGQISERLVEAEGSHSVDNNAWKVTEDEEDQTTGLEYVRTSPGNRYVLNVKPKPTALSPGGESLAFTVTAKGPAAASSLEAGGLRLVMSYVEGPEPVDTVGKVDCLLVPESPSSSGIQEYIPLEPLCKVSPMANSVTYIFTVETGMDGVVPEGVVVDSIRIDRL